MFDACSCAAARTHDLANSLAKKLFCGSGALPSTTHWMGCTYSLLYLVVRGRMISDCAKPGIFSCVVTTPKSQETPI